MPKPTLAFIFGLICDAELWSYQHKNLCDLAESVIPDLSRDDDIVQLGPSVLAVLPKHFSLAGLSMGGYVALEMLRQAPERIESIVAMAARVGRGGFVNQQRAILGRGTVV